jgi:hypothetical protein
MGVERRERNGKVVYLARPHVNGRRLRSRAFDRERDAKRYVRDQESRRHRHATDVRVADYVTAFLEDHAVATRGPTRGQRKSQRTISTYRYALKRFAGEYGNRRLDDFDRPLARKVAVNYPPSNMVVIRNMFGTAHDDGLVDTNPFADLQLAHSDGRATNAVMSEDGLHRLADSAFVALGPELVRCGAPRSCSPPMLDHGWSRSAHSSGATSTSTTARRHSGW